MNMRSTTPVSKFTLAARGCVIAAGILSVVVAPFATVQPAHAEVYDAQIKALEKQIGRYENEASKLQGQRRTLENQLAKLTNERNQLQTLLDLSLAKEKSLNQKIKQNEKQIIANRSALGDIIADMYVDQEISPLEMLASSNNISEFIDKQANQEQVQTNLQDTIDEIEKLKKELETQRKQVKSVIADQTRQRAQLVAKENDKQNLISETRGKESAYQQLSQQADKQRSALQQKQRVAIAARLAAQNAGGSSVAGDPNRGGYPNALYNAPMDTIVDDWGMYNRECVSYTAWKVFQKNGYMPYWGGVGNANEWPGNAQRAGIKTSSTPKAGSVGVMYVGTYGHVVWVESVNSDGTINISQFNETYDGHYSERYNVSPYTYDTYIYF